MRREKFLTVGWNNLLSIAIGIPVLSYVIFAFSTSLWMERSGLVWLAAIGVLY